MALVAFADAATVVVPATTDRALALAAVPQLTAGPGGTRYRTALARAAELIGAREGRVVVITDLQQAGWEVTDDGGLPDGVGVEVVTIPPPASNIAVTSAERRDRTVLATVQNYGPEPARVPVALMVEGKQVATVTVDVAPLSATDARLNGAIPATGAAQVVVDDAAGYQGDNIRHLVLEPRPAIEVTVVVADPTGATGGLYVERALAVAGGGREFKVDAVDGRAFSAWTADAVARQGAIVLVGTRTLDRTGRELVKNYLASGGQVWLTLGPDIDPATLGDIIGVDLGVTARAHHRDRRRDPGGERRPSSHLSSVSQSIRRAWGRPSRPASASKRSGRPHGAGAVFRRRPRAHGAGGRPGPAPDLHVGPGQPLEPVSAARRPSCRSRWKRRGISPPAASNGRRGCCPTCRAEWPRHRAWRR